MPDRVLVLSDRLPMPVIGGDRLRIYRICRALADAGTRVQLACFSRGRDDARLVRDAPEREAFEEIHLVPFPKAVQAARTAAGWLSGASMQVAYHRSASMERTIRSAARRTAPRAVLAHLIRMAPFAPPGLAPRRVLEMTDMVSAYYREAKRRMRGKGLLIYSVEEPRVRRLETECVASFDATVVVSERERARLAEVARQPDRIRVIPNGVPEEWLGEKPDPQPGLVVFHGSLAYPPNADAALFFAREVLPKVPGARFRIVGADPPRAVRALQGVEVTGTVESVVPHLLQAAVAVCPLRAAAGIQNKVLEAMALGVPVVATPAVLAGIDAEPGRDLIVCRTAEEMAREVGALLGSAERRRALAEAGRRLVRRRYLWKDVLAPYPPLVMG